MWTVNFQMSKLVLEKAEEPEIKLPTSTGSLKKQKSPRKTSISVLLTMPKPLTVGIYFCFIDYAKAFDCGNHNKLWKILKEIRVLDHLTCFLRNLYEGQEATVRTGHGTTDWFQIGKGICQGCILSPCLLTSMQSTSWETLGWKEHKLESRLPGETSVTSDMQMAPSLCQKLKRN